MIWQEMYGNGRQKQELHGDGESSPKCNEGECEETQGVKGIARGGGFHSAGSYYPVIYLTCNELSTTTVEYGFRVVLYLKQYYFIIQFTQNKEK